MLEVIYHSVTGQHDLRLVGVAGALCLMAAFTSFAAFEQARSSRSRRRLWIVLAAIIAGTGIWATHFVAMLAYAPGFAITYDFATTVVSIVAAVFVCGCGWAIATLPHRMAPAMGGGVIGTGVGIMHYTGMASVSVAGEIVWNQQMVIASIALGVLLSAAAAAAHRRCGRYGSAVSALLLTSAICSLHFTSMAAVQFRTAFHSTGHGAGIDNYTFAVVVAGAASLIFLTSLALMLFERGMAKAQLKEAEQRAALAEEVVSGARERESLMSEVRRQADISNAALNNIAQGLSMYDDEDRLVIHNQRYRELYQLPESLMTCGTPRATIIDYKVTSGIFPGSVDDYLISVQGGRIEPSQIEVHLGDGRSIAIQRRPLPNGGWIATHEDVTAVREANLRIGFLASHDPLTGLPNRVEFAERLATATASAKAGERHAVHMIDLDRFKEVNDTLGHPVGDEILKQVATRLRAVAEQRGFITRIGGDEFAILQTRIGQPEEAAALAEGIIATLSQPFAFDGHTVAIGASIGISLAPRDSADPGELLKLSDLALYKAKFESRGTFRFFQRGMAAQAHDRRRLESDLKTAIRQGQFEVYYQPLLGIAEGEITSLEALVRWNHPTRGIVLPGDFIATAEETGLIIPIGEWVLRQACRDASTWPADVRLAVNLSPAQFKRGDIVGLVKNALDAAKIEPSRLDLEITESVLIHDEDWVRSILEELTDLGVSIVMDDFGTGYSSLAYLRRFPFAKIKIDRSFVADVVGQSDSLAIVQATIQLSKKLGMKVTAEGVETNGQMELLVAEGCNEVQGYHLSRPLQALAIAQLLATNPSAEIRRQCATGDRRRPRLTLTA